MNYRTATEGEQLIKPLYYNYPKKLEAYKHPTQYLFGTELMVAPITTPNSDVTATGSVEAWLPQGDWFDLFDGRHYYCENDRKMTLCRAVSAFLFWQRPVLLCPFTNISQKIMS